MPTVWASAAGAARTTAVNVITRVLAARITILLAVQDPSGFGGSSMARSRVAGGCFLVVVAGARAGLEGGRTRRQATGGVSGGATRVNLAKSRLRAVPAGCLARSRRPMHFSTAC